LALAVGGGGSGFDCDGGRAAWRDAHAFADGVVVYGRDGDAAQPGFFFGDAGRIAV